MQRHPASISSSDSGITFEQVWNLWVLSNRLKGINLGVDSCQPGRTNTIGLEG
jgi:hypothetical protein